MMKRTLFYLCLAAATIVCGCKGDNPPEPVTVPEITLTSGQTAVISDEGGSAEIAFKATAAWTAASSQAWLTVNPQSGEAGETGVTVTATANGEYDPRTATVTLTCGNDSKTVTVTQKQKGALLISEGLQPVGAEGGQITITAKANSNVTAAVSDAAQGWITDITTKALTDYVFTFEIAANTGEEARSGNIVFTNETGSETVTISQEGKPAVPENPYGDEELEKITATTTWEGAVFDAIITANTSETEWTSPDGKNFINAKLGYLAGQTTSVDENGNPKVTYGKFKFKKDEKAYTSGTKMSRLQLASTGVLGKRNNLQFKVAGPGTLTIIGRSSGDAARMINFAIGTTPVSETGFEVPGKAADAATLTQALQATDGDIISIWSMENAINLYSIKWTPEGGETPGPDDPQPGEVTSATWDFGSDAWQAALAQSAPGACAETNGNVTVAGWSVSLDGLTYTSGSSGKGKWSTTGYINPSGGGSDTERVFSFTAANDGTLTVVASNTGESEDNTRMVTVKDASGVNSQVGGANSLTPVTLTFTVKKGAVKIYPTGNGLRFYSISFGESGETPGPDDPDTPPVPGEGDELECPNPPTVGEVPIDQLVGYGASVTGGNAATGANILHFNNGKALQTWLLQRTKDEKNGDHSAKIIWLSGTFGPGDGRDFSEAHPWFDVKDVSNLSFYGTDSFVMDRIGFFLVRANNIIIRNINFKQPKANNGADAVSIQTSDGVWVDHCTFTSLNQTKDYEDGSTDITHASKNVTVSWCRYIKTQKSCLVGHSNSASADAAITATFHHNWFDGSSSRHPRVRFGKVHVYNNLFGGCTTYGVGSAYGAKVLVEYNYFDGVQLPTDICTYPAKPSGSSWVSNLTGSVAGYLYATQDVYVNKPANSRDPYPFTNVKYTAYNGSTITPLTYADFKPSYSYTVTAAEDVPTVVKAGAGYGKLGWTEAPVAVNNGGITDFNGTDDNPTDPDPDDPDDPDDPGDTPATGLAEGWNWINNGATASYSLTNSQLSIASTGKWESSAQTFGYVYREVTGDFTATVQLVSYSPIKTGSNQAVAGLMIVNGDPSATANNLVFANGGNTYGNFRASSGASKSGFSIKAPTTTGGDTVLKMVREGNKVKMSLSLDGGTTFGDASSKEFTALGETVKIGLCCNSGDSSKQSTAVFANFKINNTEISF